MSGNVSDDAGRWLPLKVAAPLLGLERDTLRKQLARGERQGRHDNRGRWLALVPVDAGTDRGNVPDDAGPHPGSIQEASRTDTGMVPDAPIRAAVAEALVTELRRQIERLSADLDRERHRAEEAERRQAERDWQLDEVLRRLEELQDQARRSHRPGLRVWWRRVWEGS